MSSITEILGGDLISDSREDINNNFEALNDEKIETSTLDTDTTLAANSDTKIATQKAVRAFVLSGGQANASETERGLVEEATDGEVTAGTATGSTGAKLFVTPAKLATYSPPTKFSTTQVFSGESPTTYTDLDLSAVVGATQKMVLLKVTFNGSTAGYSFRTNGDTTVYKSEGGGVGSGTTPATAGVGATVIVKTDTAGVVEWETDSAESTTVITVEAYW
jgi:hypothetical protein